MGGDSTEWGWPASCRMSALGHKQTFNLNVRFSADYVRFSPKSGRIDTVTMESARDPKQTFDSLLVNPILCCRHPQSESLI